MRVSKQRGFTLLELLISLTIIAVMMTIIFGALRTGVRAWEKGEKSVESQQRCRIVLSMIQRQLSAISLFDLQGLKNKPFYLKGDELRLQFLSGVSLVPANEFGMVYVQYRILRDGERQRVMFYEKNMALLSKEMNPDDIPESDFYPLFSDVYDFRFEYLQALPAKDALNPEFEWLPVWEPEEQPEFPLAVRIVFQETADSLPFYTVVPVKREMKERKD